MKKNLKRIKNLKTQSKEKKPPIQKPKIRAALRKGDGQTKISNNYDTSTIQSDANTKVEEDNENIYNSKERKFEKESDLNSIIDQLIKTALLDSKTAGYDGDVSDTQVEVDGISDPSDDEGDSMDNSLDLVDIPSEEIDLKMGGGEFLVQSWWIRLMI